MGASLSPEILAAARTIGLLDEKNKLVMTWFGGPLAALRTILANETQRAALFDLLDQLVPPEVVAGVPGDERWHPLLGPLDAGNVYVTVRGASIVGLAGEVHGGGSSGEPPRATLRVQLPLVRASETPAAVAGDAMHPLTVDLRVRVSWVVPANPIAIAAVRVTARLPLATATKPSVAVTLEGLALVAGESPRDVVLDLAALDDAAVHLVLALIKAVSTATTAGVASLLALLGFDGTLPRFPVIELLQGPQPLQAWLTALLDGPKMTAWLGHLGALLGTAGVKEDGSAWLLPLFDIGGGSSLALRVGRSGGRFTLGTALSVAPTASTSLRLEASATLAALSLTGAGAAALLPEATIVLRAPGDATSLVAPTTIAGEAFAVGQLRAGVRWDGSKLTPIIELDDVTLGSAPKYPRLDLSSADAVIGTASAEAATRIKDALGHTGAGLHLAALAGLVAPEGVSPWPYLANVAALFASPSRAIAETHRSALAAGAWKPMFTTLARLVGLAGAVAGTGSAADPWRLDLGLGLDAEPAIELVAWNARSGAGPELLRIGLRAASPPLPWQWSWTAELLAVDLPPGSAATIALFGAQHGRLRFASLPDPGVTSGLAVTADSLEARLDFVPGSPMKASLAISNLAIGAGATITIPTLSFPGTPGLPPIDAERALRWMLARAAEMWGNSAGAALVPLLGLRAPLGASSAWPLLGDGAGGLVDDTFGALRGWLARLATSVDAEGAPFFPAWLGLLRGLLGGGAIGAPLRGAGTYDDPWALPASNAASAIEALVWLEPAGPPASWTAALATRAKAATTFTALLAVAQEIAAFAPHVTAALEGADPATLQAGLEALTAHLADGDGVVPFASQQLAAGVGVTLYTKLHAAHAALPKDADAVAQIRAQLDAWAGGPGKPRSVLLLGPAFADPASFSALVAGATASHFAFRAPGIALDATDFSAVKQADFYTAGLADDGSGDLAALTAQIGRAVERMRALRPAAPVIIVAWSTAGLAARAFVHDAPTGIAGLVALGVPFGPTPLAPLRDARVADAVRLVARLVPDAPSGPLREALAHLTAALDGWIPPAKTGDLPIAAPYPIGSFTDTSTSVGTSGVPVLVLASSLLVTSTGPADLPTLVGRALANAASAIATRAAPTHVAIGVRAALSVPAAGAGTVKAAVTVRGDAFRIPLAASVTDPPRAPHRIVVRAILERTDGWLLGSAGDAADAGGRVRRVELGVDIEPAPSGPAVTPVLRLHEAALRGPTSLVVKLGDPEAAGLLGAVFHAIGAATSAPPVAALLDALIALGIAVKDPTKGTGIAADALAAIVTDARAFLEPRLATALDGKSGLLGLAGPAGGPYALALAGLPFEVTLAKTPWAIGLRTRGAGLPLADAALTFDASLPIAGKPSLDGQITLRDLKLRFGAGRLSIAVAHWLDELALLPSPGAAAIRSAVADLVPRLLVSGAFGALIDGILEPDKRSGPIDRVLSAPGPTLALPSGLGRADGSGALDGGKLRALLSSFATALGSGPDLKLPGGLAVTVLGSGSAVDPLTLRLATAAPLLGVIGLDLRLAIDQLRHVTTSGTIRLDLTLAGGAPWGSAQLEIGTSPAGIVVKLTPAGAGAIEILPSFNGLDALMSGLTRLLPTVLDHVVAALGTTGVPGLALAVAVALGVYDATTKRFDGDKLRALPTRWLAGLGEAFPVAVAALMSGVGVPGSALAARSTLKWKYPASGTGSSASIALGWDGAPLATLGAELVHGSFKLSVAAGREGGKTIATLGAGLLLDAIGLDVEPTIAIQASSSGFDARLFPLGDNSTHLPVIHLVPAPRILELGSDGLTGLAERVLVPLAADLALLAAKDALARTIGGVSVREILVDAGIIDASNRYKPRPIVDAVIGFATSLAKPSVADVKLTDTLGLAFVSDATGIGVRLTGHQDVDAGDVTLSILFGDPWSAGADAGLSLYLFQGATFKPTLHARGCGVGLAGASGRPLVNTDYLRLGGVSGYLFLDVAIDGSLVANDFGAGVALRDFGLPLGQALGGSAGGDNPVAAGLLQSDGGSAPGGDPNPVNPALDIAAWYDGKFHLKLHTAGEGAAFWLPVHRGFGPLYIDRIGLEPTHTPDGLELLVDGSVKVAGLTVQIDELGVTVPFTHVLEPGQWSLDLRGLGVSFTAPGVSIAGGLRKSASSPVEYDGILSIDLAGLGFTAAGGYSRPGAPGDNYPSLFIFVSLPIVIGGPPFLFITGLGGGVGYNRELHPPTNVAEVPTFPLVAAIDDNALANDPMGALVKMGKAMPPRRGAMWLAAGIRFTSFGLVHSTALVYVALDGGFEVGILGVSRMVLPSDELALASVELALKARFSSREGLLSIQAQLTDNSWLLSRDCQLTGGFAFFVWFNEAQFLLTLGGYHPAFQKRAEFPEVPRLGYHWQVFGALVIKGESYFALTNSCMMLGGSFDATFEAGPIRVWFNTHTDFLIAWDPFSYAANLGISVGASFSIELCFPFVGCATISITVSIGANLAMAGPPLHGEVTVDLAVASVTVPFGPSNVAQDPLLWSAFADKYLYVGDPERSGQGLRVTSGLLPPSPQGAQPAPGTADQPWALSVEFAFLTQTRMAASKWRAFPSPLDITVPDVEIDIAPMQADSVSTSHYLKIERHEQKRGWFSLPDEMGTTPALEADYLRRHFEIAPVVDKVPEALWRYHREGPAAAANTVPAVTGMQVKGNAILEGKSALIAIGKIVEDSDDLTLPLPLRAVSDVPATILAFGQEAYALARAFTELGPRFSPARVLAKGGAFDRVRGASGLGTSGLSAFALRSLATRASPPRMAPLSTGMTMEPVALPPPVTVARRAPDRPVVLDAPRLRAVLQGPPPPAADAPPAPHTSVREVAAAREAPRRTPPRPAAVQGARLVRVAAPNASRPTTVARPARTLRNPGLGFALTRESGDAFARAADDFAGDGVVVPAGTTHVWELPSAEGSLGVRGAAVRLTWLGRGGGVIRDEELIAEREALVPVPAGAAQVAVTCLGAPPDGFMRTQASGLGAVSAALAPAGHGAVTGWQVGNQVAQVGQAALLGRGACVIPGRARKTRRDGHPTAQAMVSLAEVLADQAGVETWLPPGTEVVVLLLDQIDPAAADEGDLAVHAEGATLTAPLHVGRGRRVALVYDVTARVPDATALIVAVGSAAGYRVGGVVGLRGRAIEVAAKLRGGIPDQMVPDGPLTPHGEVRVRRVSSPRGTP